MSIAQSILANPGKYSIAQLRRGVETGTIPAYIAIPLIQEKMRQQQQAKMAEAAAGAPQQNAPSVAQEVLANSAPVDAGVAALPSGLPAQMAGGGIVAFEEGGEVERYQNTGLVQPRSIYDPERDPLQRMLKEDPQVQADRAAMAETLRKLGYSAMDLATLPGRGVAGAFESAVTRPLRALGVPVPYLPESFYGGDRSSMTPYFDRLRKQEAEKKPVAPPATPAAAAPVTAPAPAPAPAASKPGGGIYDLVQSKGQFPAPPRTESMEDVVRRQMYGTETEPGFLARSEARSRNLFEELGKNKLEGKAFEGLESDIKKEAEAAGADRQQAKYMAFLKAGLATMAGTSRHALENIGKGAMTGFEDYKTAVSDLKKAEKERQRQMAFIEQARRAEAQDNLRRRDALLEKANASAERRDEFGTNAIINATGKDRDQATEIWKTQFAGEKTLQAAGIGAQATLGAAKMRLDAMGNRGTGLTPYQLAQLRAGAEKMVDQDAVRAELAKSLKLAKTPAPGADKSFDEKVAALYQTKLDEVVARRLGVDASRGGGVPNMFAGYRLVPDAE
jgi:hypothetical protein